MVVQLLELPRFANNAFTVGKSIVPLISTHFPALAAATKSIGSAATWAAAKTYVLGAAQKAWAVGQAIVTGACTAIGTAFRVMGMAVMANPIGLAIGGIAIGATLLISNWGKVKEFFVGVWSSVVKAFTWAWDKIKGLPLIGVITEGASAIGSLVGSVGKAIGGFFGGDDGKSSQPGSAIEKSFTASESVSTYPETSPQREIQIERAGTGSALKRVRTWLFNHTVNVSAGVDSSSVKSAVVEANSGLEGRIRRVVSDMFAEQRRLSYG